MFLVDASGTIVWYREWILWQYARNTLLDVVELHSKKTYMKIFFSTSPRTKEKYKEETTKIYEFLHALPASELTEKFIENIRSQDFYNWNTQQKKEYFSTTKKAILASDICIFETSHPSTGVGYLVNQALKLEKPCVILYKKGNEPFMLDPVESEKIILTEYTLESLKNDLTISINYAADLCNLKFNLFISPEINNYLIWSSQNKSVSKSHIVREIINKYIREDQSYPLRHSP